MEGLIPACSCRAQGQCPVCLKPQEVALRCSLRRYLESYPAPRGARSVKLSLTQVKALLEGFGDEL